MKQLLMHKRNKPISFSDFLSIGWNSNIFLDYCEKCARLRAAIIIEENGSSSGAQQVLDGLLMWIGNKIGEDIQPDFDLLYALKRRIRYVEYPDYTNIGNVPYIYRSEEDFRQEFEDLIREVLCPNTSAAVCFTPACGTKSQAESLLNGYETEKSRIWKSLKMELPEFEGESSLYAWAKEKAEVISQLEELESNINALHWRIEEFENGGEFDPQRNTLYVYQGFIKCMQDNHPISCVNARIKGKDGTPVYLNVNYCSQCKQFFISYSEYQHYRNLYGILIAKIVLVKNGEFTYNADCLAAESPLKLCGYSVAQADGFSEQTRHTLLQDMIQSGILSKPEVIRYLSWFIQMNGQRYGNEIACKKWTNDLAFVRSLGAMQQDTYNIDGIKKYPGYRKL